MAQIDQIKRELAELGVMPHHKVVRDALDRAKVSANATVIAEGGIIRNPRISQKLQTLLSWVSIIFTGAFLVLGVLTVLFLFPISEGVAVREGMLTFGTSGLLASVSAVCLVIGINLAIFIEQITRSAVGAYAERHVTLATIRNRWNIFLGHTQPTIISNEVRLHKSVSSTVTVLKATIILLSFFGRSASFIMDSVGNWRDFLLNDLLLNASAVEFIGAVGTALVTWAMLQMTETIIYYVYMLFTSQAGTLSLKDDETKKALALAAAEESALQDLLLAAQIKSEQKALEANVTLSSSTSTITRRRERSLPES